MLLPVRWKEFRSDVIYLSRQITLIIMFPVSIETGSSPDFCGWITDNNPIYKVSVGLS